MTIVFTITTQGHGAGGHMYSLKEIATALNLGHTVKIINIGRNLSPVLENSDLLVINILSKGNNPLFLSLKTYKVLKEIQPDIIQSFDPPSYFHSRVFAILTGTKIIITKCGGINPSKFYPFCQNHIFMSYENFSFFKQHGKFRDCNMALIPNRLNVPIKIDEERIQMLRKKVGDKRIILRISRISDYYNKTFLQSLNLLQYIQEKSQDNWCLVLIGQPEDLKLLAKVKSYESDNILIITEKLFTDSAFELLQIADIVVGTGNSAMESGLNGKNTFVPTNNSEIPLKLTTNNFKKAFQLNFSERLSISEGEISQNMSEIDNMIRKNEYVEENISLKNLYFENFSLQKGKFAYEDFYEDLKPENNYRSISDFSLHLLITYASWIKNYRN